MFNVPNIELTPVEEALLRYFAGEISFPPPGTTTEKVRAAKERLINLKLIEEVPNA